MSSKNRDEDIDTFIQCVNLLLNLCESSGKPSSSFTNNYKTCMYLIIKIEVVFDIKQTLIFT